MSGAKDGPPSLNLSRISYNDKTWHGYALPKEDPKKYINHVKCPLISADNNIFHRESANFALSRNRDIDCILTRSFKFFYFFCIFKDFCNKYGYNFENIRKFSYSSLS